MSGPHYAAAGVDLAGAELAKRRIAELVQGARTPRAVGRVGGFGGMVRLPEGMRRPVLVMSTDGVGTKVLVAAAAGRYDSVGEDLVNHSVNDILVHGARPLAFLDYLASADLPVTAIAGLVEGIARACRRHDMDLAGGETAQMPGLYQPGQYDLAGTIIGVAEEDAILHGEAITPGDLLLAYGSTGLHTNGYSLARRIVFDQLRLDLESPLGETGHSVADALLAVHQSYFEAVMPVLGRVHGLAHITGGGIPGNLVRILPSNVDAVVDPGSWELPPLFRFLQEEGRIANPEMRDVFNLGVGFVAVLPPARVEEVQSAAHRAGVTTWIMGGVRPGTGTVRFASE